MSKVGTDGPQTGLPAAQEDEWVLAPCKFCGGEGYHRDSRFPDRGVLYEIACIECGASTSLFDTPEEARAAWNRVAPTLSGAEGEIARLREALGRIAAARLDTFSGPHSMAMACVTEAREALDGAP
jgi:hypothetical protein